MHSVFIPSKLMCFTQELTGKAKYLEKAKQYISHCHFVQHMYWCFTRTDAATYGPVHLPISVAERSKPRVCGHPLPGIADSNPARGMDVCLL